MRSHRKLLIAIFFVGVLLTCCSTRQVYEPAYQSPADILPDAININTATASELETLPHIGRKTAEAIVAFRSQNGPFRRPEYLLLIRGVSENRFFDIRPHVRTE